jgi:hypothetical protein
MRKLKYIKFFEAFNQTGTDNSGVIKGNKPYTWNANNGLFAYTNEKGDIVKVTDLEKKGITHKEFLEEITKFASRPDKKVYFPNFTGYKEDVNMFIPDPTSTYAEKNPQVFN